MADTARVVHAWEKSSAGEEVRASVSTFQGRRYVDLRVYFTGADSEAHPTRKGIAVAVEQLSELAEAVRRLRAAVDELPEGRPDRYTRYARLREAREPREPRET